MRRSRTRIVPEGVTADGVTGLPAQQAWPQQRADIALSLAPAADGKLKVRVDARLRPDATAELVVVLYENDLSHAVKAGENRGVTLHHDFVFRDWAGPLRLPANGHLTQTIPLALPADSQPARLGVAAFVQGTRSRTVLQAVARDNCS